MLYQAAKVEKEVIWHTSGSAKAMDPAARAFRKEFPGLELKIVSIGSSAIGTRLIAEAGAGRISVDVSMALLSYVLPLVERDLLEQYDWAKAMGIDPGRVSFGNRFVDYAHAPRIWIYNTNLVTKDEAPKTMEEVLDPKWKGGKIGIRAAPSGFAWLFPEWKKDKEKVIVFLKRFVMQDVIPGKRDAMVTKQIADGQMPIGAVVNTNVGRALADGAPLGVIPVGSPTASDPSVVYIPKDAPHPISAKLLMGWLISKEGQKALLDSGYGPAYPPEAGPQARLLSDNGIGFVPIKSAEDVKEYSTVFADTVMNLMNFVPK